MPRILVTTDDRHHAIVLDEQVDPDRLGDGHAAEELIERVAWSIDDAGRAETALRARELGRRTRRAAAS